MSFTVVRGAVAAICTEEQIRDSGLGVWPRGVLRTKRRGTENAEAEWFQIGKDTPSPLFSVSVASKRLRGTGKPLA
jgi:hypothetical protein